MLTEAANLASASSPDTIHASATEDEALPHPNEESDIRPKEQTPPTPAPVIYPTDLHQRKHLDNRLTAMAYMSSTMAGNKVKSDDQYLASMIGSNNPSTHIDLHHHQPVRFGLSSRYRLHEHWSVESGLSYIRLSTDISTTVDGVTTVTEQRLNYIGLPLNISNDLWESNHFGLYITTGSTIEKSLDTSLWQFSLNGSIGAEYKLTDFFSLYAESGLGYYFKDGSTTPKRKSVK